MKSLAMKSSKLIWVIILLSLVSCYKNERLKYITNNDVKYWDEIDVASNSRIGAYSFGIDKFCRHYVYNRIGKRRLYYSGDNINTDSTCNFKGSNLLTMQGIDRIILKLTNDSILLQNIKTKDSILLVKSKFQ